MLSKRYINAKYSVTIKLAKLPHEVFGLLVNLAKWWPEDFEGGGLGPNTEFVFKTTEAHYSKNRVVEFVPGKKLAWLTLESIRKADNFDWSGTRFIFELTPAEAGTLLVFTYDGVVLEDEYDRLVNICNITVMDIFYGFATNSNEKSTG